MSLIKIRWKKGLSNTISSNEKKTINSSIKLLTEFIVSKYTPKLKPAICLCPFYNIPGVVESLDSLVGLTLTEEGKVYLNSDLIKAKYSSTSLMDTYFLEIVLVHELTHLVVRDKIHHSLKWARTVIDIWKDIFDILPEWQVISWLKFKELILKDLESNMSKTKYMKVISYI